MTNRCVSPGVWTNGLRFMHHPESTIETRIRRAAWQHRQMHRHRSAPGRVTLIRVQVAGDLLMSILAACPSEVPEAWGNKRRRGAPQIAASSSADEYACCSYPPNESSQWRWLATVSAAAINCVLVSPVGNGSELALPGPGVVAVTLIRAPPTKYTGGGRGTRTAATSTRRCSGGLGAWPPFSALARAIHSLEGVRCPRQGDVPVPTRLEDQFSVIASNACYLKAAKPS